MTMHKLKKLKLTDANFAADFGTNLTQICLFNVVLDLGGITKYVAPNSCARFRRK